MAKKQTHLDIMKTVKDRNKHVNNILRTFDEKKGFYEQKAFEELLGKDKDAWELHRLNPNDDNYIGDKVAEKIHEYHLKDVKESLGLDKKIHPLKVNRLLKGYVGVDKNTYKDLFEKHGENYKTSDEYKNLIDNLNNNLYQTIRPWVHEDIKTYHMDNILSEIGADKYLLDAKKRKGLKRRQHMYNLSKLILNHDKKKGKTIDATDLLEAGFGNYLKDSYKPQPKEHLDKAA